MIKRILHIKTKGFTIIELSIVMLMAALISSLAYEGYTFFVKQFYTYTRTSAEMQNMRQCLHLLKKDIQTCERVYANGQSMECIKKVQTTRYDFTNDTYLLRTQGERTDTFHIAVTETRFLFRQQPISAENTVMDEAHLVTTFKNAEHEIVLKKQYSNKNLMDLYIINHGH